MDIKTALEFDDFLVPLNAAVNTMMVIHDHFFKDEPISKGRAIECSQALWTLITYSQELIAGKKKEVDAAVAAGQEGKQ